VICDLDKLDDAGCLGAPDLIVEILSTSTAKKDYNEKFNLYEENKVKEYWIANPATNTLEIYYLEDDKYKLLDIFNEKEGDDEVTGKLFPELSISLKEVFKD
jgi:Uma2 family endonuclease